MLKHFLVSLPNDVGMCHSWNAYELRNQCQVAEIGDFLEYSLKVLCTGFALAEEAYNMFQPVSLKRFAFSHDGATSKLNLVPAGWKESFSFIIGGDQVTSPKPSAEIYLEAAKGLKVDPSSCLVIEDSLPGVTAGKAAGMEVVAVPSLPKQTTFSPLQTRIEGTLPIEPWYIGGPVIKGFGRGSKVLGIPTANLSTEDYSAILSEHPSGVYFGWAGLATRGVYKMVMSIGWNPYFNNTEKTIEPWLLHDFNEDFYGEDLRLAIVGYIRPEANFPSLESLVAKIHEDREIAERALELPQYSKYRDDPYLNSSPLQQGS
ncbi:UNVERIFIED_CONTAM: Bifunctional riboflavin kinase/FMN phosphatase [Sesamum calycinum]|uniref:riboflavin kinase n=1 Tax=Sesamum calycinum TaxID=2727403 RepID=A0AAW2Q6E5_9LAMI